MELAKTQDTHQLRLYWPVDGCSTDTLAWLSSMFRDCDEHVCGLAHEDHGMSVYLPPHKHPSGIYYEYRKHVGFLSRDAAYLDCYGCMGFFDPNEPSCNVLSSALLFAPAHQSLAVKLTVEVSTVAASMMLEDGLRKLPHDRWDAEDQAWHRSFINPRKVLAPYDC